jgi:hypothetical protein
MIHSPENQKTAIGSGDGKTRFIGRLNDYFFFK